MTTRYLELLDEEVIRLTAEIVGPSSAAAAAIADADRRRANGQDVAFYREAGLPGTILVGPRLLTDSTPHHDQPSRPDE